MTVVEQIYPKKLTCDEETVGLAKHGGERIFTGGKRII
jgi:hypothetical protein